jgi:hypothetical protein
MAQRNDGGQTGDEFGRDLERDNARRSGRAGDDADRADDADGGLELTNTARHDPSATDQGEFPQHSRRGQAESPVEATHYEPPKHKEGHGQSHLHREHDR